MSSVHEIQLIWSEERRTERWLRDGDGWRHDVFARASGVPLARVNETIALAEIYANLSL
jgi:hypothetical protein